MSRPASSGRFNENDASAYKSNRAYRKIREGLASSHGRLSSVSLGSKSPMSKTLPQDTLKPGQISLIKYLFQVPIASQVKRAVSNLPSRQKQKYFVTEIVTSKDSQYDV